MNKKAILSTVLGVVLVLLVAFITVWAVTDFPKLIPVPTATMKSEPFSGTVNGYDGLSMTVEESTVTPTSATLVIHNDTGRDLSSGHSYSLRIHVLLDGQWYPMNLRTDKRAVTGVPGILVTYPADNSPYSENVTWEPFIGKLEPGHYRVVWMFHFYDADAGQQDPGILLSAEFDIE